MKRRQVNLDFWSGKKVFLTGNTGFKGSWLSLWLQSMGVELYGFSLPVPPTLPSLYEEAKVGVGMTTIHGDIRNFDDLYGAMKGCGPEIVIHMAAQPLVRSSYLEPLETYATNTMGTVHVLEAARRVQTVKVIVNVTTDKCYENNGQTFGYDESSPIGGHDPYSNSKGCSELVTSAYRRSFFKKANVALASARSGNVIGGGDWALDRLVPDIFRAFEKSELICIRKPNATRPWQHVLEPLSGYLLLAESLYAEEEMFSEGWNFGPSDNDSKSVGWIVEQMIELWGEGIRWELDTDEHPHEASYLQLDIAKAQDKLNWMPLWDLRKALEMTVDWHRSWLDGCDMNIKCLEQINEYQREK